MARRKRPSVTDYLADLDQPAVATSSRKRKAQTAPLPAATTGKRRKITLYFRQALLIHRTIAMELDREPEIAGS